MKKRFMAILVVGLLIMNSVMLNAEENQIMGGFNSDEEVEEYIYNKYINPETGGNEIEIDDSQQFMYDNQLVQTSFVVNILREQLDRSVTSTFNGNSISYTYKIINLQKNTAIQKAYVASSYLYFIQKGKGAENNWLFLSRVALGNSSTINAANAQMMTLKGFGHSQTLEYFDYDDEAYFWIGCNASSESMAWARQLGIIKFVNGAVYNSYTQIKRLININKANSSGTSLGTTRRSEAALSTDKQYFLIWCRTYDIDENGEKSNYKTRYSIYDHDDVASALIEANSMEVSCSSNDIKAACLNSFQYIIGNGSNATLRYGSCQGLEINNSKQVFVASEAKDDNYPNGYHRHKYIYKLNSSGTILSTLEIVGSTLGVAGEMEMEGLQIKNSQLYVNFANHAEYNNVTGYIHYIYQIPFSAF